jgi:pyridoxamine 5'-phosphate oxidase
MPGPHDIPSRDPLALFDAWFAEAHASEPNDSNAAALATSTVHGVPSVRMVLVKRIGQHRFCFFTNIESRKGHELAENPRAALCFHWKSLRRQIRVEGTVSDLSAADTNAYFHSRPRASQISAAVSDQSRILQSREELEAKFQSFSKAHPGEIPRPDYWRGFHLHATQIEFWINGPDRLHDRFLFTKEADGWRQDRLYP